MGYGGGHRKFHDTMRLSGNTYISARMRAEGEWGRIVISKPQNCDHVTTVCLGGDHPGKCARSWQRDYEFMYDRTNGGRKFREDLKKVVAEYEASQERDKEA